MPTKPVAPVNPLYGDGKFIDCGTTISQESLLSLLDNAPLGRRNVNATLLRCLLVSEVDSTLKESVLSMDRWPDCEMMPLDPVMVRAKVLQGVGSSETDLGFLDDMFLTIEDAKLSGDTESLGFLNMLGLALGLDNKSWPRLGTAERAAFNDISNIGEDVFDIILDMVTRGFPKLGAYKDDTKKLARYFIDLVRLLADTLTEYRVVWEEQTKRWWSVQRKDNIGNRYAALYGAKPSSATIRAWCRYGEQRGDGGLAPDGTTERFLTDTAEWNAKQAIATVAPSLREQFGSDYRRFFALNAILAGWYGGYKGLRYHGIGEYFGLGGGAMTYSEPGLSKRSSSFWDGLAEGFLRFYVGVTPFRTFNMRGTIEAGARNDEWLGSALQWIDVGPANREENASVVQIEKNAILGQNVWTRYRVPFWENTVLGNFRQPQNFDFDIDKRIDFKSTAASLLFDFYEKASINAFARDMIKVWVMWDFVAEQRNPGRGRRRREKWIASELTANRDRFLDGMSLFANAVNTPEMWANAARYAVHADVPAPSVNNPKYRGTVGPCPDGTTGCLPCEAIKSRRPIGAKVIDIPMSLTWTGSKGALASPEFAAWKRGLNEAGYPDYYVDCLTRDLAFVAGPGATTPVLTGPCPFGTVQSPSGQCIQPTLHTLPGLPRPLGGIALPGVLRGITRPVVAELAGPILPRSR